MLAGCSPPRWSKRHAAAAKWRLLTARWRAGRNMPPSADGRNMRGRPIGPRASTAARSREKKKRSGGRRRKTVEKKKRKVRSNTRSPHKLTMRSIALIAMAAFAVRESEAFATLKPPRLSSRHSRSQQPLLFSPDLSVSEVAAAATSLPAPLLAASAAPNALASAVVAYLHYAGFLLSGVCLTAERLTLKV